MLRFRFAPSPTGHLHVGGARTAILNWLLARHHGGVLVLRIEDTDAERNVPGAEEMILEDLRWLGLDWDEGPDVGGPFGPYRQSERSAIYRTHADRLLERGDAYFCTCPPATEALGENRPRCACAAKPYQGRPVPGASVRFRSPDAGEVVVEDAIRGRVVYPAKSVEDFVLLRSDGRPTYNFAAAVDDAGMRISHVIRGADHLNNTPKQVVLYRAMDREPPVFAHIPLILGPDRQKLSKRHGATSVAEHQRLGYLPAALVNYLSLLSWSSPSGEEFLPPARLVEEVDLGRVGASDAMFDRDKLRWLSGRYLEALSEEELLQRALPFVDRDRVSLDREQLPMAIAAVRGRISLLSEVSDQLGAFVGPQTVEQRAARRAAVSDAAHRTVLEAVRQRLAALPEWEVSAIDAAIREGGREAGARGKSLFLPVRLALTGEEHGPELARIAAVLGRERSLELLSPAAERV
jgi:glutamyl-tRNA synthetase